MTCLRHTLVPPCPDFFAGCFLREGDNYKKQLETLNETHPPDPSLAKRGGDLAGRFTIFCKKEYHRQNGTNPVGMILL